MEYLFWLGFVGVGYAYFGYPALLTLWARVVPRPFRRSTSGWPTVSIVLPAYNEADKLKARLENLAETEYLPERIEFIVISDGSSDDTNIIARNFQATDPRFRVITLEDRAGKGNALNVGVSSSNADIVVFTDAGISLDADAIRRIVAPFGDSEIGCVSGEDWISGSGGEALYGRYELFLRQQESKVGSLVGASGSFYAQRRHLVPEFVAGVAPDFHSVLHTVSQGYRAVSEPKARGSMAATASHTREFRRKVRTVLRGMTAIARYRHLLNPFRAGSFALVLASHKIARWLVPFFLALMLATHFLLLGRPFFQFLAFPHLGFYVLAILGLFGNQWLAEKPVARVPAYFVTVNAAIAVAALRFVAGVRQELWEPTARKGFPQSPSSGG